MGLTDADYGAIQDMVARMIGKAGVQPFIQAQVVEVDGLKRLIYVKELADVPIPMVEFKHEVKIYIPVGGVTQVQKRITTPLLPEKGDIVLVALVMGERRMPRCLGVISAPATYLVHPGE